MFLVRFTEDADIKWDHSEDELLTELFFISRFSLKKPPHISPQNTLSANYILSMLLTYSNLHPIKT